jgi:type IV pilus assembly protein PilA
MESSPSQPPPLPRVVPPPLAPPPSSGLSTGVILAIVIPIVALFFLGILAAIAIPAFVRYTRKSKASEARVQIAALISETRAYYEEHRELPPSVDWTPPGDSCMDRGVRFPANPSAWRAPTWQALGFQPGGPHYYQYRFLHEGPRFAVEARADLDCNGVFSSYRRSGGVDGGEFQAGPLEVDHELE